MPHRLGLGLGISKAVGLTSSDREAEAFISNAEAAGYTTDDRQCIIASFQALDDITLQGPGSFAFRTNYEDAGYTSDSFFCLRQTFIDLNAITVTP